MNRRRFLSSCVMAGLAAPFAGAARRMQSGRFQLGRRAASAHILAGGGWWNCPDLPR